MNQSLSASGSKPSSLNRDSILSASTRVIATSESLAPRSDRSGLPGSSSTRAARGGLFVEKGNLRFRLRVHGDGGCSARTIATPAEDHVAAAFEALNSDCG